MTMKLATGPKCPECQHGHFVPFARDEELDYDLGEETIKVFARDVPVERCDACGIIASGPAAAKVRHEAVCRAIGLLTPSEIKAIRDKYGWSQQDLANLTDFGIATVSRWERGRLLQNRSANKVLLALRDCPAFREYVERLLASEAKNHEPVVGPRKRFEMPLPTPTNQVKSRYSSEAHVREIRDRKPNFSLANLN